MKYFRLCKRNVQTFIDQKNVAKSNYSSDPPFIFPWVWQSFDLWLLLCLHCSFWISSLTQEFFFWLVSKFKLKSVNLFNRYNPCLTKIRYCKTEIFISWVALKGFLLKPIAFSRAFLDLRHLLVIGTRMNFHLLATTRNIKVAHFKFCFRSIYEIILRIVSLQSHSSLCCRVNVYWCAIILRNLPYP